MTERTFWQSQKKENWYLVFWEDEESVTLVPEKDVLDRKVGAVTKIKGQYTGLVAAIEEMSRLDELFLRGKYHPVADQNQTLTEILAIPLDNKRKRTQKSKEKPTKKREKPTTSEPKKKPKGTIITVTGHGGTIHPNYTSAASTAAQSTTSTAAQSTTSTAAQSTPSMAVQSTASMVAQSTTSTSIQLTVSMATASTIQSTASTSSVIQSLASSSIQSTSLLGALPVTLSDASPSSSSSSYMEISDEDELATRIESSEVRLSFLEHQMKTMQTAVIELQSAVSYLQAAGGPLLNPGLGISTPGFGYHQTYNHPPQGCYSDWGMAEQSSSMLESSRLQSVLPSASTPSSLPAVATSSNQAQLIPVSCPDDRIYLPSTAIDKRMLLLLFETMNSIRRRAKLPLCAKY